MTSTMLAMTKIAARAGLGAATAAALFAWATHAEIRPGEASYEDLAPPGGAPIVSAPQEAPIPRLRARAVIAAKLGGARAGAPDYSLDALALKAPPDPALGDVVADVLIWREGRLGRGGSFAEMRSFLRRRGDWPSLGRLRLEAERAMPESLPMEERALFFTRFAPMTARGARLLAETRFAAGDQTGGEKILVEAWRNLPASRDEEQIYLDRYETLLAPHHKARVERLIWRRELAAAQRLTQKLSHGVSEQWSKLMDAVAALHRASGGVDAKIKRVPEALRTHPSLLHALMVWRERKRRRADAEDALREADAGDLGDPSAWASKRMLFARSAYEDGRPQDAAAMAGPHGLSEGVDFADLEWFAGWMQLGHLDEPKAALAHFERLWDGVSTSISRSRAAYWAAEAAEAAGAAADAARWRARAAALPDAFYGQLAAEKLNAAADLADAPGLSAPFDPAAFDSEELSLWLAAEALYIAEAPREAERFVLALAERRSDPAAIGWLARRVRANDDYGALIKLAKRAFDLKAPLWSGLYPIPDQPRFIGRRVEPALLLAIARQESRFRRAAASGAGATGLMQLMPATAKASADRLSVPYEKDKLVESPEYNLALADSHLATVLAQYDGSYVLAIAAYNAGGGNVSRWIKQFGDPRDEDVDPIQWIESIPFQETRNYVQRVLEATQAYRIRLGLSDRIALTRDLARGRKGS